MKKEFDYYIFVDYSECLIGYMIIDNKFVNQLINKTFQFRHFKELRNKNTYLLKIKKIFDKNNILSDIDKIRVLSVRDSLSIFMDIIDFINKSKSKILLITLDDKEYIAFTRIFSEIINKDNITVIKESQLIKGEKEYRLNLVLDNILNIERRSKLLK